jgi:hypothetical protein
MSSFYLAAVKALLDSLTAGPPRLALRVPATIPHDGSLDVTDALSGFFRHLPPGSTVLFQPGGHYRVDGTLELRGRKGIGFDGQGCVIDGRAPGSGGRDHWRAVECEALAWRNMTVVGSRPLAAPFDAALQHQHGFSLRGVTGYDLANVTVRDVYGDGLYNGKGELTGIQTTGGRIHRGVTFARVGRNAVSSVHAAQIEVDQVSVIDPCLNVFDIEPNGPGYNVSDHTYTGARVAVTLPSTQFHSLLYAGDPGAVGGKVDGILVRDCVLRDYPVAVVVTPPAASRWRGIAAIGNSSNVTVYNGGEAYATLTFAHIDGLTYRDNTVPAGGIQVQDCTGVVSR